ncbi:hypothetical protein SF23_00280 [Streptomyces sp. MBRL 10]|nr:hypothetical protein SF23_00280 [Streptomyces sp. MBRL 10]
MLAAVGKILDNGGGSLNLDVLTPAEYHQLTRTAGLEQLGHFGGQLVSDAPPPWVDGQAIVDTAAEYTPSSPPKGRPMPPQVRGESQSDPFASLEEAEAHEAVRRQVLVEDLLAGLTETDVTAVLEDQAGPLPRVSWWTCWPATRTPRFRCAWNWPFRCASTALPLSPTSTG